jgi:hypothetical protein
MRAVTPPGPAPATPSGPARAIAVVDQLAHIHEGLPCRSFDLDTQLRRAVAWVINQPDRGHRNRE